MSGLRYFVFVLGMGLLGLGVPRVYAQRVPLLPDLMVTQTGDSIPCLLARQLRKNLHIYHYTKNGTLRLYNVPKDEIRFFQKRYFTLRFGVQELLAREFKAGLLDTSHRNDLPGTGEASLTVRFGMGYSQLLHEELTLTNPAYATVYPATLTRSTAGVSINGGIRATGRYLGFGLVYSGHLYTNDSRRIASHYVAPELCFPIRMAGVGMLMPAVGAGMIYHTEQLNDRYVARGASITMGWHVGTLLQAFPGHSVSPYVDASLVMGQSNLTSSSGPTTNTAAYSSSISRVSISAGIVVKVGE